jgi:hypothetical protein
MVLSFVTIYFLRDEKILSGAIRAKVGKIILKGGIKSGFRLNLLKTKISYYFCLNIASLINFLQKDIICQY